ncbi:DegT/DnrJ/EryC1/StrS family aminotransferase [Candidatus Pelagibacter sp.]|nr:DegT/DnrJ/EryC1/StrS family aminotransferase [Candidatus Pelagibacter sp.]
MSNYPLATSTWDNNELEAIQSVIDSDNYTMGNHVRQFENDFGKFINRKYCLMVSSGSAANLISIASFFYTKNPMLKKGDEVIVPAVSWSTTYFPLQQFGLKLKFVDIDLNTLNYDLDALKLAITKNTKMIVAVNLLGNPNDFDTINKIIKDKNIFIFEDNCESLGAEYKGRQTGTFGVIGTFSTYFSHHISTMEGGFVTTDNEEIYHILLSLRAHGWTRNLPKKNHVANKSDDMFEESFRFVLPGYNVRPIEMSGAIGVKQLKKTPSFLKKRRENAKLFIKLFKDHPNYLIQKDIDKSSWFGFSLIIKPSSNLKRKDIINKLQKNDIECRPIVTGNFVRNEVMKYFDYEVHEELKNANYLHDNGFFVGNSHKCLSKNINFLSKILS